MDNETKQILKTIEAALVAIAEISAEHLDLRRSDVRAAREQSECTDAAIAAMRSAPGYGR